MDEIVTVFANAYRSERLVYRDIENSDADKEVMHTFGPANHVSWGLLSGRLFRDVSKKTNLEELGKLLETDLLLKVLICLPAPTEETAELGQLSLGERGGRERETATVIGSLTLSAVSGSLNAITTTVGLAIGEMYQNNGYGGEAINWAVDWAFKFANVHKVEIATSSFNERAIHLYQKLGFKLEGRKREVFYVNRKYHDLLQFGMLESEWKELRGVE
ncbi:acyl-CoA N-acyltransferase [Trichoderma evansii]